MLLYGRAVSTKLVCIPAYVYESAMMRSHDTATRASSWPCSTRLDWVRWCSHPIYTWHVNDVTSVEVRQVTIAATASPPLSALQHLTYFGYVARLTSTEYHIVPKGANYRASSRLQHLRTFLLSSQAWSLCLLCVCPFVCLPVCLLSFSLTALSSTFCSWCSDIEHIKLFFYLHIYLFSMLFLSYRGPINPLQQCAFILITSNAV